MRRRLVVAVFGALWVVLGCGPPEPGADGSRGGTEGLHRDALVWDAPNDLAYRVFYEGLDMGQRLPVFVCEAYPLGSGIGW